jgi:predicted ATPase/DNA-binding winged helix-turn-helix (wHTH) protein
MVSQPLHFFPFHLLPNVDLLYCDNVAVALEPQAVRVLRYLIEQRERVVPKEELLDQLWPDTFTTDDVLKKAVSQARRALGDDANAPRYIRTLHGRGYQFIGALASGKPADGKPTNVSQTVAEPVVGNTISADPDYDQLFGRAAEWQMLCAEYRNALNGTGRPMLIAGEPGIGKTQLARHFGAWVKTQGGQTLFGRFFDYDGSRLAPYETFLDLLRTACGLSAGEALSQVLATRFNLRLPASFLAEEANEFPRSLPLTITAQALHEAYATPHGDAFQTIVPLGKAFIRLSRQRPLLLVLDDLQWADETSRELIGWLMRNADAAPLLIVLLARVEEMNETTHALHQWLKRQASYRSFTSLALKPLDEKAFRQTIEATFAGLEIPVTQLRALRQATGGNPYFLTEMLRFLVAENVITRHTQTDWRWHATEALRLPANLTLATEAKLERLTLEVREIAEQAAVIGDEFRLETLARMTERNEEELECLLEEAVRRGVLSEHGVSAGEHFRFYHSLLRRVLYDRLTPRLRGKLHLRAAAAVAAVYVYESDRVADAISGHYEQGGAWQQAYEWSWRAWQAARQRWQWHDAATALERAGRARKALEQRHSGALDETDQLRLQLGLGESYASLGRFREAESCLLATIEQSAQHPALAAAAHRHLSRTLYELSRYTEAIEQARLAQSLYRQLPDLTGEALTLLTLCRTHAALGNFSEVETLSTTVLPLAGSNVALLAELRGLLGWTLALQARYAEAQPLLTRALEHAQSLGNIRQQAQLRRRLHWLHLSRGDYETSFALAQAARDDFRSVGDASGEAKLSMALGQVRAAQGLFAEAMTYWQRTLQSLQDIGDRHCEAETYWLMGRTLGEQGELAQAHALLTRALTMVRELGDRDDEFRVLTDLARIANAQRAFPLALELLQQAGGIAQELGNQDGFGLVQVESAFGLHGIGQLDSALAHARSGIELLSASGSGELWRAQYALGFVLQKTDPAGAQAALRQAVALLTNIHEQISPDQTERRALAANARPAAARLLAQIS